MKIKLERRIITRYGLVGNVGDVLRVDKVETDPFGLGDWYIVTDIYGIQRRIASEGTVKVSGDTQVTFVQE